MKNFVIINVNFVRQYLFFRQTFVLLNIEKNIKMKSNKALMGVMAGAATGAVLGVLFAAHKGSSTRKRIMSMG